jgi:nucleotide-binding universal stress UspA family protein
MFDSQEPTMTIKTVAAILTQTETAKVVLDTAIAIAAENDAHVVGLHAEAIDPPPVMSPFDLPDSSVIAALYDVAAQQSKVLEVQFNEAVRLGGVVGTWRVIRGGVASASQGVVSASRIADLVVAGQPQQGRVSELDDVLFESGRPVLFIPYITKQARPFNRVLIAWDGSRESTRAIFDALPLLKKAAEVEIFSVDPLDAGPQATVLTGTDIAEALDRHGLKISVNSQQSEKLPIYSVIENRCSDFAADLLIMGAYSHARIRERLFGGVTHTLLQSMTVPVLMSR